MLSSSLNALLKMSKMTSPKKLFDYDCITPYLKTFLDISNLSKFWFDKQFWP